MFNMAKKKKEKKKKTRIVIDITVVGKNDGQFRLDKIQQATTDLIASMKDISSFNIKVETK